MKKVYVKIISAAVALVLLLTGTVFTDKGGIFTGMAASSVQYTCNPNAKLEFVKHNNNTYAVQFRPCQPIDRVSIYVAKTAASGSSALRMRLYAWQGGYGQTVRGTPLAERLFTDFEGDTWLDLDCPAEAGEYLLVLSDTKANVQLRLEKAGTPFARTYLNASERDGNLLAKVTFREADGTLAAVTPNVNQFVTSQTTWVAVDELGRTVDNSYESTRREGKTVGLFFHTWHSSNAAGGTRNITHILAEHPEIQNDFSSPLWGHGGSYFWDEPIWGYYRTSDEWVLRKQAELLADAGVDAVFFDNTNGTVTFLEDALTLLKVWSEARADGVKTPQVSFMLPMFEYGDVAVQLRELYKNIYREGIYKDLWFYWKGKPLMVGYPGRLDPKDPTDAEILDFFNYRVINHAQSQDHVQVQSPDGTPEIMGAIQSEVTDRYTLWNWISTYPQLINKNPDGTPEQVAVAIAHNWCAETHLTAMNNPDYKVFGRDYQAKKGDYDSRDNAVLYGAYFCEQWDYALDVDPEFIWVTGWNEWVAGRFEDFLGVPNAFPDNFSPRFSRDIEPSKGILRDNYYYLLCSYIRKFKGTDGTPTAAEQVTVNLDTGEGWDRAAVFESYPGDTFDRDCKGYRNDETNTWFEYRDNTGRNDLVSARIAYDKDNIYFQAETLRDLTPYTDPAWMRLFLDTEGNREDVGWESFSYVVNRKTPLDSTHAVLEKSEGGWNWTEVGTVDYRVAGNRLSIRIPRALLGLTDENFVLNFKWADNTQTDGEPLDFYTSGDAAPGGRFKYQFCAGKPPKTPENEKNHKNGLILGLAGGAALLAAAAGTVAVTVNQKKKKEKPQ